MPPKAKFTKEDIINASLEIIREGDIESLTARSLAKKLNSSARPIFTLYSSMDEVINDAILKIKGIYDSYILKALKEPLKFKAIGASYIMFAVNEPKFFQILFMKERKEKLTGENFLEDLDEDYNDIISIIGKSYNLSIEQSKKVYLHLFVFTHGLATLCATKVAKFQIEDINHLLTLEFNNTINNIKNEK